MAPGRKTSLPEGKETMRHFTHPHVLFKEALDQVPGYERNIFGCDGCGIIGSGTMYYCKKCDFGLHEDCATCPEHLTSKFHPNHQLERIWEGADAEKDDGDQLHPCGVCGDEVKGLYYKCSSGAAKESNDDDGEHCFFIHPTCSKIPSQIILNLQSVPVISDALCAVCGNLVSSSPWSYRSDPSGLNLHLQCVTTPYKNDQSINADYNVNALAVAMATSNMMARYGKSLQSLA